MLLLIKEKSSKWFNEKGIGINIPCEVKSDLIKCSCSSGIILIGDKNAKIKPKHKIITKTTLYNSLSCKQ